MENKLAITIVALMVAALAAPAVMADNVNYEANVISGQNTAVTINPGGNNFGDVTPGSVDNENVDSLTLTNSGNADANVHAKFTTANATSVYGLVSAPNAIPGNKFKIGINEAELALNDGDVADPGIALIGSEVPANDAVNYDVILDVPAGQVSGLYTGTVQLTFL